MPENDAAGKILAVGAIAGTLGLVLVKKATAKEEEILKCVGTGLYMLIYGEWVLVDPYGCRDGQIIYPPMV